MKSELPKVLFPVCNRPMIHYVLESLREGGVERLIVVIGYRGDLVRNELQAYDDLVCVEQTERLGTGHAVKVCRSELEPLEGPVVVVAGDSPMLQAASVAELLKQFEARSAACLLGTLVVDDPHGLGRIVRDAQGAFQGIVEEKDATEEQRQVKEVNMSTYVFDCQRLLYALDRLRNDNRQQEYYLTDCPGILKDAGDVVEALPILQPCEALSINTREQLAAVEDEMLRLGICAN